MTATVTDDKSGEKKAIYFYNDNLNVLQEFTVNKEQLDTIIKDSLGEDLKNSMNADVPMNESNKQTLFEQMHKVAGMPLND